MVYDNVSDESKVGKVKGRDRFSVRHRGPAAEAEVQIPLECSLYYLVTMITERVQNSQDSEVLFPGRINVAISRRVGFSVV